MPTVPLTALGASNPPSPAPAPAPASSAGPGMFARQLERAALVHDGNLPAQGTAGASSTAGAAGKQRNEAQKTDGSATQPGNGQAADKADQAGKADKADKTESDGKHKDDGTQDGSSAQPQPDVQALLASLMHRPAAAAATRGGAAADDKSTGAAAGQDAGGGAARTAALGLKTGKDAAVGADAQAAVGAPAGATPSPLAAMPDVPQFVLPQALATVQTAPQPEAVASAPAPYAAQVQAPVGSPDFAPGLSAQVSVMVRDGIQEARLQLNPAEMGPITVNIQVDGSTAQVTMTAEQAPTRDALEQAMPTLAGALREEGLTLTGGGVFEQPRQARDDGTPTPSGRGGSSSGGGSDDATSVAAAAPRGGAARSAVDLYA